MRRMLEKLFYGNISPNEKQFIRGTGFDKAMRTLSENEDKLTELLDGKEKTLFLDLVNAQSVASGTTAVENFIGGFRLGARIALEIMSDEDGPLRDIT
ncbi:DUF6809 family protein [Hungatella hathewayi]|uniref:DUF6809 family protein n=1 Tax=Hungatella hathewayi TaxID=154046 RepID=UPI003563F4E1